MTNNSNDVGKKFKQFKLNSHLTLGHEGKNSKKPGVKWEDLHESITSENETDPSDVILEKDYEHEEIGLGIKRGESNIRVTNCENEAYMVGQYPSENGKRGESFKTGNWIEPIQEEEGIENIENQLNMEEEK